VGQTAGFHTDKTSGPLFEEGHHVVAPKRFGDGHLPSSVNAMNLKKLLGGSRPTV
jgi:hypothetical protein